MAGPGTEPAQERLPPHNLEAERSVLGAILLDPSTMDTVLLLLSQEDYFHPPHRIIFSAMIELYRDSIAIDMVSVGNRLKQRDELGQAGGPGYLADLPTGVLTSVNAEYHARIVQEKAVYRRLIQKAEDIWNRCYAESEPAQALVETAERAVVEVLDARSSDTLVPLSEVINPTVDEIEKRSQNPDALIGVPTGFADLDRMMGGLGRSDLVILAARPSVGKTSLGLNIVRTAAMAPLRGNEGPTRVAVFSMEMSREQITQRLLALESKVGASRLRSGKGLSRADWRALLAARNQLGASYVYIDDSPGLSVVELLARCRRLHRREKLDLVMVDYLQLMSGGAGRGENRQQEVSEISRGLKGLAKELDVPVLALSQLSRAVEKRTDRRPQLADLRESGAIEQDADVVLFIHRPDPDKEGTIQYRGQVFPSDTHAELIVAKQRNGPTGSILLYFEKQLMKFSLCDLQHESGERFDATAEEDFDY